MKISEEEVAMEAIRHALNALRKLYLAEKAASASATTAVSRSLVYQGSEWKENAEKLDLELQHSWLSEQLVVEATLKAKTTEAENKTLMNNWILQKRQDAECINKVNGADLAGALTTKELHGDLLIQMLIRLPIKSIMRFKSVCRAWCAVLYSRRFIQQHCEYTSSSIELRNMLSLLVHISRYSWFNGNDEIFSVLFESSSCEKPSLKNIELPFECDFDIQIVGVINGLICLSLGTELTTLLLWNPAIKKHSHIEHPYLVAGPEESVCAGFGYDENSDSYKVVRILYVKDSHETVSTFPRIEIYSTSSRTWRRAERTEFPWLPYQHKGGVVVDKEPYWFSPKKSEKTFEKLIWFDAETDTFRFYDLPFDGCYHSVLDLEAMGGKQVALLSCNYHRILDSKGLEFKRALKSAEMRKLEKIHDGGNVLFKIEKRIIEPGPYLAGIVGFGRHGAVIAQSQDYNTLFLCDKKEKRPLARYGKGFSEVFHYTETLVWPFAETPSAFGQEPIAKFIFSLTNNSETPASASPLSIKSGQPPLSSQGGGSRITPYSASKMVGEDCTEIISTSAMPVYSAKSHEELRLGGYQQSTEANPFSTALPSNNEVYPLLACQNKGSGVAPYAFTKPVGEKDSAKLISISAMPVFEVKSHEELRWEDYQLKKSEESCQSKT